MHKGKEKYFHGSMIFLLLLFSFQTYAQPKSRYNITGAWTGYVKTTDKKITYEVVISDSADTYIGYSKIIFKNKGKELFAIKSLSIRVEEEKYILEEMQLLSDNFEEEAPRKIKQINTLDIQIGNRKMSFSGEFKTKATMGLKSATGEVFLQKAIDPDSSLLFNALKALGRTDSLSFVKEAKAEAKRIQEKKIKDSIDAANAAIAAAAIPPPPSPPVQTTPVKVSSPAPPPVVKTNPPPIKPASPPKPTAAPVATVKTTTPVQPSVVKTAPPQSKPTPKAQPVVVAGSAADLGKRTIETIRTVYFNTDSLVLTLYDNGEVDGDTVSVVINNKVFMGKKGLSTKPVSETFYLSPEMGDSLQMIMYAENLGAIAPNTGLLIIQDGKDRYEIRFSGDLNKNAAIIFKRKR